MGRPGGWLEHAAKLQQAALSGAPLAVIAPHAIFVNVPLKCGRETKEKQGKLTATNLMTQDPG